MSLFQELKTKYQLGTIVEKLIYINLAVFVLGLLLQVVSGLYKSDVNFVTDFFALSSNFSAFLSKPWTIISYGFLHGGFIHILFNLMALYFIGNLFMDYFSQKQLLNFYILGTFFGGLIYLISYNYFPFFEGKSSILVGASSGISAIFMGIATYHPNFEFRFPLIGFVKLWVLAIIWLGFDVVGLIGTNAGGSFAHLGGSLFGFLYVNYASTKEIEIFDTIKNWFSPAKKPLKTVYKSATKTKSKSSIKDDKQQKIDAILDKISKSGYESLSASEKEFLFKQGKT